MCFEADPRQKLQYFTNVKYNVDLKLEHLHLLL